MILKKMADIPDMENITDESFTEDTTQEIQDTTNKDSADKRKQVMMKVYGEDIGHRHSDNTQRCINVVRNTILPKMKFVPSGKGFGSFDKPDFTHKKSWVNVLFSKIPNIADLSDAMKCKVWMTYRARIKEQFSLHRAGITHKIKMNFVKSKFFLCLCLLKLKQSCY